MPILNPWGLVVVIQLLAFWPIWKWYSLRMAGSVEESCGLIALLTAAAFLSLNKNSPGPAKMPLFPAFSMLVYAISYPFLPPLLRAAIAFMAIGSLCCRWRLGTSFHAGVFCLLLLALPIIPSLQFYLGYPLRYAVAGITAPLLRLTGIPVVPEGVCLKWADQSVWIDAPCSGIKMLWMTIYLALTLACLYRLDFRRTVSAVGVSLCAVVGGNVLRSTSLFYLETGIVRLPPCAHDGVGLITFLVVGALVSCLVPWLQGGTACASMSRST